MTTPPPLIDEQLPPIVLTTTPLDPPADAPVPVPEPGTAVLMIQTGVAWGSGVIASGGAASASHAALAAAREHRDADRATDPR